jgi:hypothetical protein
MQTISLDYYREVRALMVSGQDGIRAYRVHGDLIRHCELHRDLQRGLVRLRRARYSSL